MARWLGTKRPVAGVGLTWRVVRHNATYQLQKYTGINFVRQYEYRLVEIDSGWRVPYTPLGNLIVAYCSNEKDAEEAWKTVNGE